MEDAKSRLGVEDYSVSQTTLDQVGALLLCWLCQTSEVLHNMMLECSN